MMQREIGSFKNNSIAFNIIEDDPTMKSYLALAYCIAGVKIKGNKRKYPEISTTCRALGLLENTKKEKCRPKNKVAIVKKEKKGEPIIVTNTVTGEEVKYDVASDVVKAIGIPTKNVHNYIHQGTRFKGIYQLRYAGMAPHVIKPSKSKKVKCTNEKTGEVVTFNRMKDAAKYLGYRQDHITYLARECKVSRQGWRVEKI